MTVTDDDQQRKIRNSVIPVRYMIFVNAKENIFSEYHLSFILRNIHINLFFIFSCDGENLVIVWSINFVC